MQAVEGRNTTAPKLKIPCRDVNRTGKSKHVQNICGCNSIKSESSSRSARVYLGINSVLPVELATFLETITKCNLGNQEWELCVGKISGGIYTAWLFFDAVQINRRILWQTWIISSVLMNACVLTWLRFVFCLELCVGFANKRKEKVKPGTFFKIWNKQSNISLNYFLKNKEWNMM